MLLAIHLTEITGGSILIFCSVLGLAIAARSAFTNEWRSTAEARKEKMHEQDIEMARMAAQLDELAKRPDMTMLAGMLDRHSQAALALAHTTAEKADVIIEQGKATTQVLERIDQHIAASTS